MRSFKRFRQVGLAIYNTLVWPKTFAPEQESDFLKSYARIFLPYRRAAIILGALFWFSFFYWDLYYYRTQPEVFTKDILQQIQSMRWAVLGILVVISAYSFSNDFCDDLNATTWLLVGIGAAAAGILYGVFFVVPRPLNYIGYYVGLYLVVVFMFTFAHLRARITFFGGIAAGLVIWALELQTNALGVEFQAAMHYYLSLFIMCHGVGVKLERYARNRYRNELRLHDRNTKYRQAERQLHTALRQQDQALNNERKAAQAAVAARRLAEEERERADEQTGIALKLKDAQRVAAEQAMANKTEFVLSAAHDIRQPLYAAINYFPGIRQAFKDGNICAASKSFDALASQVDRAIRLTEAIMHLSQLEAPDYVLRLETFRLNSVIADLITSMGDIAQQNRVEIRLRESTHDHPVLSDRVLLRRVISNLMMNAIKYTDPAKSRPSVLIGTVGIGDRVRIDIADNGLGIKPKDFEKIFRPFVQVHQGQPCLEKGHGLGLAFVHVIMSKLPQHRIEFKSVAGIGTRFSLYVPLSTQAPEEDSHPAVQLDDGATEGLAGLYVLLVEDDQDVRHSLETLLTGFGLLVDSADSLSSTRNLILDMERDPDLVVTDFRLIDGGDGAQVIKLCKEHFGETLPCMVLTAEVRDFPELDAMGITVLRKPVAPERLLRQIWKLTR